MDKKTCTFFGHRICPDSIKPFIQEVIEDLILNNDVEKFYVGNHGQFDNYVQSVLQELKKIYPHISYFVVLSYFPSKRNENDDYSNTLLPDGLEYVHPRYAIKWCNNWQLRQSDFVVSYVTHEQGGAAQFYKMAKRQGKVTINLYQKNNA